MSEIKVTGADANGVLIAGRAEYLPWTTLYRAAHQRDTDLRTVYTAVLADALAIYPDGITRRYYQSVDARYGYDKEVMVYAAEPNVEGNTLIGYEHYLGEKLVTPAVGYDLWK